MVAGGRSMSTNRFTIWTSYIFVEGDTETVEKSELEKMVTKFQTRRRKIRFLFALLLETCQKLLILVFFSIYPHLLSRMFFYSNSNFSVQSRNLVFQHWGRRPKLNVFKIQRSIHSSECLKKSRGKILTKNNLQPHVQR